MLSVRKGCVVVVLVIAFSVVNVLLNKDKISSLFEKSSSYILIYTLFISMHMLCFHLNVRLKNKFRHSGVTTPYA